MKKIYFLSSIPRSGNTLLSSILNQNPRIGVTANSILAELLYKMDQWKLNDVGFNNFPDYYSYESLMENVLSSYYSKWGQDYIIDRASWGTPDNFKLIQRYCPNEIKVICLTRDISEVFCSLVDWCSKNPKNYINLGTNNGSIEEKFNFLMHPNGQIMRSILSIYNLNKIDPKNDNHILIDYNNFVTDPKKELDKIYKFLNIPKFEHKLNNFSQFSINGVKYDDHVVGENLHKIRTKNISKRKYNSLIPDSIIEKCKSLNSYLNPL